MKKGIVFLLFFSIVVFSMILTGCFDNPNEQVDLGNNNNNNNQNQTDEEWLILDAINYNPTFSNYEQEGNGFLIYDELDLDTIQMINEVDKYTVSIVVVDPDNESQTIIIGAGSKFGKILFRKTGEYHFNVRGQTQNDHLLEENFSISVITGNRPDRIEYSVVNSENETVEVIKGGDTYTFTARLYSREQEYIPKSPQDAYWGTSQYLAPQEYEATIGNIIVEEERPYGYRCFVTNNMGTKINIVEDASYLVKDNLLKTQDYPEGIYFSYGGGIVDGTKEISINANDHPNGRYFLQDITAEYRFDNGDIQEIEISETKEKGKAGLYISYDNENYNLYSRSDYDYRFDSSKNRIQNYYSNDVHYQFDPTKDNARMYMAVWREKKEGNSTYLGIEKVEESDINLNLISQAPSSISISSISGKHKNDDTLFSPGYKTFTKNPIQGNVNVYICCDMDGDEEIEDEYLGKSFASSNLQFFKPDISTTGGNLLDYTLSYSYEGTLSPIEFLTVDKGNGNLDQYFVGIREGRATITVTSRFSSLEASIEVTVVNKIFENEKRLTMHRYEDCYGIFSDLNFEELVKIKEYRLTDYDENSFNLRDLREDEILEYRKGGTVISPDSLSYSDNGNMGQEISIYLQSTQKRMDVRNIYILPDFDFSLNGQEYSVRDLDTSRMIFEGIEVFQSSDKEWFFGYVPYIQLSYSEDPILFEITDTKELENDSITENPRYITTQDSFSVTVKYSFYYTNQGITKRYDVPILIIQKM